MPRLQRRIHVPEPALIGLLLLTGVALASRLAATAQSLPPETPSPTPSAPETGRPTPIVPPPTATAADEAALGVPTEPLAPVLASDAATPERTVSAARGEAGADTPAATTAPGLGTDETPTTSIDVDTPTPPEASPSMTPSATSTPTPTHTPVLRAPQIVTSRARPPFPTPTRRSISALDSFTTTRPSRNALDFAAGGLLALLAGSAGYTAARWRERAERRRHRRALATAMLAELRWIDAVLRKMAEQAVASYDYPLDHPITETALRDLTLFRPETAGRIAHFHTLLQSLRYEMHQYRENPKPWTGRLADFNRLLQARAALACRVVPELNKNLRREGGALPPPLTEKSAGGETAALPPTPFGAGETDDWTL